MADTVECVVVGAGIIGLAVARALALQGREVLVLEQERVIGAHTSSRNSEVIHAGLYYPKGSLKARFCVEGKNRLYAYCAERGIAAKRIGKLVVAADEREASSLAGLMAKATANGVGDLELLDGSAARALEPELSCAAAFHSPSTGIIDSHALMLSYQGDAENAGARLALRAEILGGRATSSGFDLEVGGDDKTALACKILVNAAGLYAPSLARRLKGVPPKSIPRDYYCRGVYFTLSGKAPFKRLIYPVPEHAGLGVHYTADLGGQGKFGPDIEWISGIDYTVDPKRGDLFYAAIRKYWPGLKDGALQPGYAGIRPKISGPAEPAADFLVQGPKDHGVPGLVNLYGIESPGLTSSLPLADYAASLL
jgi:L-2-hydroxyglutarate oxidase LhgO